jgi:predicted transcriptional regulator
LVPFLVYGNVVADSGNSGMKKTTIYFPDELLLSVRAAAKRTGRSEASLIREAVETYMTHLERPWPRSIGSVDDGTLQPEEIEDWIDANWRPE